jgi:hypothetical protein
MMKISPFAFAQISLSCFHANGRFVLVYYKIRVGGSGSHKSFGILSKTRLTGYRLCLTSLAP